MKQYQDLIKKGETLFWLEILLFLIRGKKWWHLKDKFVIRNHHTDGVFQEFLTWWSSFQLFFFLNFVYLWLQPSNRLSISVVLLTRNIVCHLQHSNVIQLITSFSPPNPNSPSISLKSITIAFLALQSSNPLPLTRVNMTARLNDDLRMLRARFYLNQWNEFDQELVNLPADVPQAEKDFWNKVDPSVGEYVVWPMGLAGLYDARLYDEHTQMEMSNSTVWAYDMMPETNQFWHHSCQLLLCFIIQI